MLLPLDGGAKPVALLNSTFNEGQGAFSPDMRWFAYVSDESGRNEVYVQPFNPPGSTQAAMTGKWQISRDGGTRPKWSADGKQIVFRGEGQRPSPMVVDVTTSPVFQAGVPKPLFTLPSGVSEWDMTADGKRFLVAQPAEEISVANDPITLVLNWEAGVGR